MRNIIGGDLMKKIALTFYTLFSCSAALASFDNWHLNDVVESENNESSVKNEYDDVAKALAGMKRPEELDDCLGYMDYANSIEDQWNKLNLKALAKIPQFTKEHIIPKTKDLTTLFYPCGGPDVTYAFLFFPRIDTLVLTGLELIGNFDSVKRNINNISTFKALQTASKSFLDRGFFITSEMGPQLFNNDIKGCIYLILLQLSKLGFEIVSVKNVSITNDGEETDTTDGQLKGLKIQCRKDNRPKTVYYLRLDFRDHNKRQSLMQFMKSFKFATFIKSSSYKMHEEECSEMRDFILKNSQAVLQDDTGIPLKFYDKKWTKYPFGRYAGPTLRVFGHYTQPDMIELYNQSPYTEVPFALGYGFNQKRTNLLLAVPLSRSVFFQIEEIQNHMNSCNCNKKKDRLIQQQVVLTKQAREQMPQALVFKTVKTIDDLEFTIDRPSRGPAIMSIKIKN